MEVSYLSYYIIQCFLFAVCFPPLYYLTLLSCQNHHKIETSQAHCQQGEGLILDC